MRVRLLIACATIPLVIWGLLPLVSGAAPNQARLSQLDSKIDRARNQIGKKKGTERALGTDIQSYSKRITRLQGKIDVLAGRQATLQSDLDQKQAELDRLRDELRSERARLTRLKARLKVARSGLSDRLVEMYKASDPDVITVILNSDGFADLLERTEFIRRISAQDRRVVGLVQDAKVDAVKTEARLDKLEARQQKVTAIVLARRDQIRGVKDELVGTRVGYDRTKAGKQAALIKVRSDRHAIEEDLEAMEKEQGKIQAQLQGTDSSSLPAGGIKRGSGSLIWPVNASVSSGFGPRSGCGVCSSNHMGIDLPVPVGTPIRAAAAGRVAIAAPTGGYGNYTCIQHTQTMSTCYGHQSRFATSVGARVRQGQVFGYSGNTGNSTGPHLHFEVRINGTPVDPLGYL
ncbi:MAG: peptidoglycan DD-metalloendopeptidase family protein [Solirubrobacteraceae bacterium]|nr:peptidoglycan DD-metalloendopeptidase family protein [Solirubrobacteraceae bacterium]